MTSPSIAPLDSKPEERRFLLKLTGLLLALLLVFFAALSWRGGVNVSRFPRVKLSDGTWLVARAVSTGTKHAIEIPYPLDMQLTRWRQSYTEATTTGSDRMVIWLTRENDKGDSLDLKWFARAEIVISEDFAIPASTYHTQHQERNGSSGSGTGHSGFSDARTVGATSTKQDVALARCEFPLVRPREGKLRLNVYDGSKSIVAVLEIPYPKLPTEPTDDWQIEPFPVTKSAGNLDVTVKGMDFRRSSWNHGTLSAYPKLEFLHDKQPSQTWSYNSELFDTLGNQTNSYQCDLSPLEPVWKLRLTLNQTTSGQFLPEETGSLPPLALSPAKQLVLHSTRHAINGTEIQLVGLGGQGPIEFTLPNSNSSFKTKAYEPGQQGSGMSSSCSGNRCDVEFSNGLPFLITHDTASPNASNVQLIVRDQDGEVLPQHGSSGTQGYLFWFFGPKPTSASVTFQFIVQKPRQVEFFVAPPQPGDIKSDKH
ncbi:MAG: hypothetical protein AABP62_04835 [Planctomycetota bacterium]